MIIEAETVLALVIAVAGLMLFHGVAKLGHLDGIKLSYSSISLYKEVEQNYICTTLNV